MREGSTVAGPDPAWTIEPLDRSHDRAVFSCGVEALDRYLKQIARQEKERGVTAVFVLTPEESTAITGYYTLSALSVAPADLPPAVASKLPRYDALSAILIGRLAVDQRYRGKGLGSVLLIDALARAFHATAEVGAVIVVVDAKDTAARSFYEHQGFERFPDRAMRLFMTMDSTKKMLKRMDTL